jgi:hypothetical protein
MTNVDAASEVLKPFDESLMRCYLVSTRINQVSNDDEGCSAPVELVEIQNDLFSELNVKSEVCECLRGANQSETLPQRFPFDHFL